AAACVESRSRMNPTNGHSGVPVSAPDSGTLSIAAAVCTRDRPAMLRRALGSLHEQEQPPAESLVVDNGPRAEARQVVTAFPRARYLRQPERGLNGARNRALTAADADIVAFLDDDAVAPRDWLVRLCADLRRDPGVAAC